MRHVVIIILMASAAFMSCAGKQAGVAVPTPVESSEILQMSNQRMLVVEAKGDPNIAGASAFGLLFQLYYSIPETPKGPAQPAPRARWPFSLDTPKTEWIGLYAMPVPESVTELPPHQPAPGMKVSLTEWEYGDVAQVVYVGPYDKEGPVIERLKDFITDQGYKIVGPHEEEYLKGPTMYSKGDPEKYVTVIRYRVSR